MAVSQPCSADGFVPLEPGTRIVLECSGYEVSPSAGILTFLATRSGAPGVYAVCCLETEEPVAAEEIRLRVRAAQSAGATGLLIVCRGTFDVEAIALARSLSVDLVDGSTFQQTLEALPQEAREKLRYETTRSRPARETRAPAETSPSSAVADDEEPTFPPLSASWDSSSRQSKRAKLSSASSLLKIVGMTGAGLALAAISAALLFPGIRPFAAGDGEEVSASDRNAPRLDDPAEIVRQRTAQQLASVSGAAHAMGIDFVAKAENDLQRAIQNVVEGETVADAASPFFGTYIGHPMADAATLDGISRYLAIENGILAYTGPGNLPDSAMPNFPSPSPPIPTSAPASASAKGPPLRAKAAPTISVVAPAPPSFPAPALPESVRSIAELRDRAFRQLSPELVPLVSLSIPADAPVVRDIYDDTKRAFFADLWKLDEVTDRRLVEAGQELVESKVSPYRILRSGHHQALFDSLAAQVDLHPHLVAGSIREQTYTQREKVGPILLETLEDPLLRFPVAANQVMDFASDNPARIDRAYRELERLLDETRGLSDYDQPSLLISVCLDWPGPEYFEADHERIATLIGSHPDIAPWLKDFFIGKHHIDAAWDARGSGPARSVSATGWIEFERHLRQASLHLQRSWEAYPESPVAAGHMIIVEKGLSGSLAECRKWFDRSIGSRADFGFAYLHYLDCLQPRWHGSPQLVDCFGFACLATERFDTIIPTIFINTRVNLAAMVGGPERFWERCPPEYHVAVRRYFAGYRDQDLPAIIHRENAAAEAFFLFSSGNQEAALPFLPPLDYDVPFHVMEEFPGNRTEFLTFLLEQKKARKSSAPFASRAETGSN